jgi:hypothetical protein
MSKSTRTPLKSTKRQKLRLPRKSKRRNQLRTTRLIPRRMRTRSLARTNPPLRKRKKALLNLKHLLRTKLQHPKLKLTISDFVGTSCKVICKVSWRNLKL